MSRGKPVEALRRGKRFDRINIIGILRDGKPIAVERYRHTANGAFFVWWFEKRLLRELPKGYTVIMDNAGFHSKQDCVNWHGGRCGCYCYRRIHLTIIR